MAAKGLVPEPLAFGGKFIERGTPCGVLLIAIGNHVPDQGPAVSAHPPAWNAALVKKPGGKGAGNAQ